jgi:signal transduction histidine kinase
VSWIGLLGLLSLVGLIGAIGVVGALSSAFRYYLMGDSLLGDLPLPTSLALAVVGIGGLSVAVWRLPVSYRPPAKRIDYVLLVVVALAVEFFSVSSALVEYATVTRLFVCTLVSYAAGMGLLIVTLARLRDRCLAETICWTRLWKTHPVTTGIGATMTALAGGSLLWAAGIMLNVAGDWLRMRHSSSRLLSEWTGSMVAVILLTVGWVGLTYVCQFLTTSAERYEQANSEKVRAERFKAELLANVSHDIRSPLTSIINYVDLLKADEVDKDTTRQYVDVLDRKSTRLKTLLDDLIDASKLTTGNVATAAEPMDLAEIVGQVAGEWDDQFESRGLTLVLRQPDGPIGVEADSRHLWRVLENLFSNATKYALPGTRVFSEITVETDHVTYRLKNTSADPIDLPAEALTEQFIRGDRSRHSEGNGLGLYIAKSLVETMGGALVIHADGDLFDAEVRLRSSVVMRSDQPTPTTL